MIELACDCGHNDSTPESSAGGSWNCPKCGRSIQLACAEQLPENAGQGDFDASFIIIDGPDRVGQKILLGGVTPIEIGKLQDKHILLTGNRVSRNHCRLNRVDFGPSRWEVEDTKSTNGTFINDQRVGKQELSPGDILQVGEFQLQFDVTEPAAEAVVDLSTIAAEGDPPPAPAPGSLPAPTLAPPPPPMAPPLPPRRGSTLSYQRSGTAEAAEERLLGDCDPKWVMMLRNASSLMVCSVGINFGARFWIHSDQISAIIGIITSLMNGAAAWMLTVREPDAVEKPLWSIVRISLRIVATIATLGGCIGSLAVIAGNTALLVPGLLMSLAGPVQVFLFLFYLRKLAARLPSPGLAISCIIVMVGLPASLGIIAYGAIMAAVNPAGLAAGAGASLATMGAGLCSLVIFAIWYVVILFWFNKSFS